MNGDFAKVDFGEGTVRDGVNISLVKASVGEYVLVHAGYAIQVVDEAEALETLRYWRELLGSISKEGAGYEKQPRGGLT